MDPKAAEVETYASDSPYWKEAEIREKVKQGMTEAELLGLFGEPVRRGTLAEGGETLTYMAELSRPIQPGESEIYGFTVAIVSNRVVGWTPIRVTFR